jgi:uncharacterized protein (TIGR00290 family)
MKVACSWSGGKDSCLACHKAIIQGVKVSYLINTVSQEYDRVLFHGIKSELARLQARLAQFPIVQPPINKDNYEEKYIKAAAKLKADGIEGIVYGDIALQDSRNWNEKVCEKLKVSPIFPLWGQIREQILNEFIDTGFKAIVTCTQANLLDKEWVGRWIDKKFIQELSCFGGIDLCGENGEYHTFVTGGPLFKGEIKILETEKVFKNGYWFLDILRYEVV